MKWLHESGWDFVLLVALGVLIVGSGLLFAHLGQENNLGRFEITFLNGDVVVCDVTGWYDSKHNNQSIVVLANGQVVTIPLASVKWVRRLPKK